MIKFTQGAITNMDGETKDIIVKAAAPNNLGDALIGGSMVLMGIIYLTTAAFRKGSETFGKAEYDAMVDLGIITD